MSAQWRSRDATERRLATMTTADLDAVMSMEIASYDVPWSRGNFVDSLASGYVAHCLFLGRRELAGYFVAMPGQAEAHLLNLTVAPAHRTLGHARHMLDALVARCRATGLPQVWLEVRVSNLRARRLYGRYGFAEVGLRKAYYPPIQGSTDQAREDAVVMSLPIGDTS